MSKARPISARMADAMRLALAHSGELVRFGGALWSYRGAPLGADGRPVEWVTATSVHGLVRRERGAYSDFVFCRGQRRPVAVVIRPPDQGAPA